MLLSTEYYQDSVDELRKVFTKLNLVIIGEAALRIKDKEALRICLSIWDTDKDGFIMEEEAAIQANINSNTFSNNTKIITFDEFKYFNFWSSSNSLFYGCTSLKSIELPEKENLRYQYFYGCISLERCIIGSGCTSISKQAFYGCTSLKEISIPDTVTSIESGAFHGTGLYRFVYPANIATIDGLGGNPNLTHVEIKGENVTLVSSIGSCPLLEALIMHAVTPPKTDYWTLRDSHIPYIYVPDTSVNAYKTSSDWSKWASRIKPISEKPQ